MSQVSVVVREYAEVRYPMRMARQFEAIAYNQGVQEVVTKELLLAILDGQVSTGKQSVTWLEQHPVQHEP